MCFSRAILISKTPDISRNHSAKVRKGFWGLPPRLTPWSYVLSWVCIHPEGGTVLEGLIPFDFSSDSSLNIQCLVQCVSIVHHACQMGSGNCLNMHEKGLLSYNRITEGEKWLIVKTLRIFVWTFPSTSSQWRTLCWNTSCGETALGLTLGPQTPSRPTNQQT